MGAVFALYSAWYFWIPKILGVDYNRSWGKVHFWILFIGVNVTFFPQHFLGLQGMPRRISDYADAFAGWNMISSFGSIISVIATFLFLDVLYTQLIKGKPVSGYVWSMPSYFSDALQALIIRSFGSLEWALSSPPKPHAFVSLPVQSGLPPLKLNRFWAFIKQIWVKVYTKKFIFSFIIVFCTGFLSRYLILIYLDVNVFIDIFNSISITYYGIMSVYIPLVGEIMAELLKPETMLASNIPPAGANPTMGDLGGGGASNPSGTSSGASNPSGTGSGASGTSRGPITISDICDPVPGPAPNTGTPGNPVPGHFGPRGGWIPPSWTPAGNTTGTGGTLQPDTRQESIGEVQVFDRTGQDYDYKLGGTNQPLASSIADSIDHQTTLGSIIHDYYFNDKQKRFVSNVLWNEDRGMYDRIFTNKRGNPATRHDWKAANSDINRVTSALRRAT